MQSISYVEYTKYHIYKLNIISRVYVWSIIFEPLLFFIITIPGTSGSVSNISRGMQLTVILLLIIKFLLNPRSSIFLNPFNTLYKYYSFYFLCAVLAGYYGFITGAYKFNVINTPLKRSYIEYFIAIYYFLYFVVLPLYILKNRSAINYFFKIFSFVFFLLIFVGVLDLILIELIFGYEGIPRHIYDGRTIGFRFHGFAGEPRDTFVYLMLGLGILTLKDIWRNEKKLTAYKIVSVLILALLTQSASGLIGWLFSSILILLYLLPRIPPNKMIPLVIILIMIIMLIILGASSSQRIMVYYYAFIELYPTLKSGEDVTSMMKVTMNNIYPIWYRWLEIIEYKFIPSLIGTGFGTASIVTNNYLNTNELLNPNANIIRTIYENGIIGTMLFISAFLTPLRKIILVKTERVKVIFLMLLLLGAFFAHRSAAPYIFLGITLVVFKNKPINLKVSSKK